MAARSNAPAHNGSERSGLRMGGVGSNPTSDKNVFFFCLIIYLIKEREVTEGQLEVNMYISYKKLVLYSEMALSIGPDRYTNILVWLGGFHDKYLYLVDFFFVSKSLLEIERQKKLF